MPFCTYLKLLVCSAYTFLVNESQQVIFFVIRMQQCIKSMPNWCMKLIDWIEHTVSQRLTFVKSAQACFVDYRFGQLQGWHFFSLLSECSFVFGLVTGWQPLNEPYICFVWWCFIFFFCQCISSCLFWHLKSFWNLK